MTPTDAANLNATADGAAALAGGMAIISLLVGLVMMAVMIFLFWRIFSKAGYSGALSLLMLFPIVNIGMLFFLAFAQWPVSKGKGATVSKIKAAS